MCFHLSSFTYTQSHSHSKYEHHILVPICRPEATFDLLGFFDKGSGENFTAVNPLDFLTPQFSSSLDDFNLSRLSLADILDLISLLIGQIIAFGAGKGMR